MQHDFILLDRSGSMAENNLWTEALAGVNGYVQKLAQDKVDTGVTLAVFDDNMGALSFEIIRDRIIPSTWHSVTNADAVPRGMTPLADAVGRLVARANTGNYDKVAIIIMTDGYENASKEITVGRAKVLLDECRAKGWQVIFLGANFDNAQQARSFGAQGAQTISASGFNLASTMRNTAKMRSSYASGASATMSYTDEEKAEAAKQ